MPRAAHAEPLLLRRQLSAAPRLLHLLLYTPMLLSQAPNIAPQLRGTLAVGATARTRCAGVRTGGGDVHIDDRRTLSRRHLDCLQLPSHSSL